MFLINIVIFSTFLVISNGFPTSDISLQSSTIIPRLNTASNQREGLQKLLSSESEAEKSDLSKDFELPKQQILNNQRFDVQNLPSWREEPVSTTEKPILDSLKENLAKANLAQAIHRVKAKIDKEYSDIFDDKNGTTTTKTVVKQDWWNHESTTTHKPKDDLATAGSAHGVFLPYFAKNGKKIKREISESKKNTLEDLDTAADMVFLPYFRNHHSDRESRRISKNERAKRDLEKHGATKNHRSANAAVGNDRSTDSSHNHRSRRGVDDREVPEDENQNDDPRYGSRIVFVPFFQVKKQRINLQHESIYV